MVKELCVRLSPRPLQPLLPLDKALIMVYIPPINSGVPFQPRDEKGIPLKPEAAPQLYMAFGSFATVA